MAVCLYSFVSAAMPALRIKHNQRFYDLRHEGRGTVLLCTNEGGHRSVEFLGFLDCSIAARMPGGRPVKMIVFAYSVSNNPFPEWVQLRDRQVIQGCYMPDVGVFCITENGQPRVVLRTAPAAKGWLDIPPVPDEEYRPKGKQKRYSRKR